jgi:hypothetical protein
MIDGYLIKHSGEIANYTFEFANELPSGETISTKTITMFDSAENEMSATGVTSSSISGSTVIVKLAAIGDDSIGMDYRLVCKVTFSSSTQTPYKIAEIRVRNKVING